MAMTTTVTMTTVTIVICLAGPNMIRDPVCITTEPPQKLLGTCLRQGCIQLLAVQQAASQGLQG